MLRSEQMNLLKDATFGELGIICDIFTRKFLGEKQGEIHSTKKDIKGVCPEEK